MLQCRATLPPSLASSEAARRLAPYIWTHQYTHLSPSTCFVLDDGSGHAVGYCIGCPDTAAFCADYASYVAAVLEPSADISRPKSLDADARESWTINGQINETCLAQTAYSPFLLLVAGNEDLVDAGYLATLHIDVLGPWQGQGWGRKLLQRLVESVRAQARGRGRDKGRGIWIGIAAENDKVVPFYEKSGFRLWQREGKRKQEGSFCMVLDL